MEGAVRGTAGNDFLAHHVPLELEIGGRTQGKGTRVHSERRYQGGRDVG